MNYEDMEKYKNWMAYQSRPPKPFVPTGGSSKDYRQYATDLEKWENINVGYKSSIGVYHEEGRRLEKQFFDDCAAELGYTDHPKHQMIENLATEYGRSDGFWSIYCYLEQLCGLIQ
jgi:hypothetical protein